MAFKRLLAGDTENHWLEANIDLGKLDRPITRAGIVRAEFQWNLAGEEIKPFVCIEISFTDLLESPLGCVPHLPRRNFAKQGGQQQAPRRGDPPEQSTDIPRIVVLTRIILSSPPVRTCPSP